MLKSGDIRRQTAQRLRDLFPNARQWEEISEARIGKQVTDLLIKFRLGERDYTLVGTRLAELRRELTGAYPVAAAVYIGPQSARILRDNGLGYIDLSGNCRLALENVLIEKEGKRNVRPSTRPLRSLFAPRATRIVRALLVDASRAWRLEELAKDAMVSLGHAHNVVKRLEELAWAERDEHQRIRLGKPAPLLEAWSETYRYQENTVTSYAVPERLSRRYLTEVARAATSLGRSYAFTLSAGLSLVAPHLRMPVIHCYIEGEPGLVAEALGVRPGSESDGGLRLLTPYDSGVFYGTFEKAGVKVVSLPQLYVDLYSYERRGPEQASHLRRETMGY